MNDNYRFDYHYPHEEQRVETYVDSDGQRQTRIVRVPVTQTQISVLASRLRPPEKPELPKRPSFMPEPPKGGECALKIGIIFAGVGLVLFVAFAVAAGTAAAGTGDIAVTAALLFGIGAMLITGWVLKRRKLLEKYRIVLNEVRARNEKAEQDWQDSIRRLEQDWQRSMQRWKSLYYCHRDDCIFVPGEGTSAPPSQIESYLRKEV